MYLVRQVFQVKFGHMEEVLAALKTASESGQRPSDNIRILTDVTGNNFTLVFETKAESLDAYWEDLQASFQDPEMAAQTNTLMQYMESGQREIYTIEFEWEG
jgi:hypothetical protein